MPVLPFLAVGKHPIVPENTPPTEAVGDNFERFTGTNPELAPPTVSQKGFVGSPLRPGGFYEGPLTYTRGRVGGVTATLGAGQAAMPAFGTPGDAIHRPPGDYTAGRSLTIRWKKGVGQVAGPSELGQAQTAAGATRQAHPPAGTPLLTMIAGLG